MGLLSDDLTRAYFGSGDWKVGLANNGSEIIVKGYRPQTPEWQIVDSAGLASLTFKFAQFARFDELVVYRDGVIVDREPFGGQVALPPGAEWVHDLTVSLTEGSY